MDTKSRLADQPGMDEIKIGPAGETLGQLKQAVRDARHAYVARPGIHTTMAIDTATRMLRAAYTRMGLPYVAP